MRKGASVLLALAILCLVLGCGKRNERATGAPASVSQPPDTLESATTPDLAAKDPTPVCPPATGDGTISPAISIYSITFVVNDLEQVVRDGDTLHALPGDQVRVSEVTICAGPFSGNGGQACVDFAPADQTGREIVSGHLGTHMVRVTPGLVPLSGPDDSWTIGENWRYLSAVLNHWPPEGTEDLACGGGRCERDDQSIIEFP